MAWTTSDLFRHMVRRDHGHTARVDLESGIDHTIDVDVENVTVTSGLDDTVRRSADVTVANPTGSLVAEDAEDLLSPSGARIRPWRGVRFDDGTTELVPLGRFMVEDVEHELVDGRVTARLKCFDESKLAQQELLHPVAIEGGTPAEQAFAQLVGELLPTATFRLTETGFNLPPLLVREKSIAWNEAVAIARSVGCDGYMDRLGVCAFDPRPLQASSAAVWEFVEGVEGTHFAPSRSQSAQTRPNVIVVVGTNSNAPGIRAEAADEDRMSPTYRGRGERVKIVESEKVASTDQAEAMAAGLLARALGPTDEVRFSAVPNPALDEGDTVAVTSPKLGLNKRRMLITNLTMPGGAEDPMEVTCRRSVLTVDDVFPVRGEAV